MKRGVKILLILILIVLSVAIYFSFFFAYSCDDLVCYQAHQKKCSPTKFVNDAEETTWKYHVKGKEDGRCEIKVTALQVKKGTIDKMQLEGKSMLCYLFIGDETNPESDISKCHGELKEELQDLIIQNLHKYIVDNLGNIGDALNETI